MFSPPGHPADDPRSAEGLLFGFSVPEQNLNCAIRHWLHPGGTVTGGIALVRGQVANSAFADFIDYRYRVPMAELWADEIRFPCGVHLAVIEPQRAVELSYASADGRLTFRCRQQSLRPVAAGPTGAACSQPMSATGELTLDGERMAIDGYSLREHRWESSKALEGATRPVGRGSAIFGPDLAFHFAARNSDCLDRSNLDWGWVWLADEVRRLDAAWMQTVPGPDGAAPAWVEVRVADACGDLYELAGETRARVPINLGPGAIDQICLMQYRMNGRRTFGDFHDAQPNAFLRATRQ